MLSNMVHEILLGNIVGTDYEDEIRDCCFKMKNLHEFNRTKK